MPTSSYSKGKETLSYFKANIVLEEPGSKVSDKGKMRGQDDDDNRNGLWEVKLGRVYHSIVNLFAI